MSQPEQRKLAAIMFTDMVGYSALAQQSEALALELLDEHRRVLRPLFPRFNGAEIKTIGDGFLVEFGSALEAAQCAIEIQRNLARRNADAPAERRIRVRIGIHLGDVVHREGDVYGDGVNIASRIEPLAEPGEICVSRAVFEQVRNNLEPPPVRLGEAALKNILVPVEVYRVILPWQTPGAVKATDTATVAAAASSNQQVRGLRWAALGLVLLALAAVVWWTWLKRPSRAPPRITSIAVRPVDDFSGDTNQAHLCDGMTEALCTDLGNISTLRVPGRSTMMGYKGRPVPIRQLAEELKVDAVLESSLQRASNRIRVTVQLVEAATDRHLWSDHYDRDLGDFFLLQSEIARAVAAEIKARLTPEDRTRLARARAGHPAAVEACLKGRAEFLKWTPEALTNALSYYRRAVNIDSNYPPAWSGLATCYGLRYVFFGLDPEVAAEQPVAMQRALSLDPEDPWAHYLIGNIAWGGGTMTCGVRGPNSNGPSRPIRVRRPFAGPMPSF